MDCRAKPVVMCMMICPQEDKEFTRYGVYKKIHLAIHDVDVCLYFSHISELANQILSIKFPCSINQTSNCLDSILLK